MPELLKVEAERRALEAHCVGRRIARCAGANDLKVVVPGAGVTRVAFERAMVGRTIVAARRRGKNLWLRFDATPFPSFQFGMADEWPSKYSEFFVELGDGLEFSFTDKRRFARVRLFEDPETVPPMSELDEVLYQSRTHPLQMASSLSRESCESLLRSIQEVVKYAVEVDADCGRFPEEWLFHVPEISRCGIPLGVISSRECQFLIQAMASQTGGGSGGDTGSVQRGQMQSLARQGSLYKQAASASGCFEVRAKAWTATFADAASSLEASSLYLFPGSSRSVVDCR